MGADISRGQYVLRRLVHMVPVLLGITAIVFGLIQIIPGDPATTMLGNRARPEAVAALNRELGLDMPHWQQYAYYLGNLATLDLGDSLKFKVSVASLLRARLEVTLALVAYATVLTVAISLPLGIAAALKKDSLFDQAVRALLMVTS